MNRVVAVMTSSGGEERPLTKPRRMAGGEPTAPFDWSADGKRILSSCPSGQTGNMGICLLSVSAALYSESDMHPILSKPSHNLYEAQFSPDGRWICFNAVSQPGISAIYVASTSGGEWTAITSGRFWDDKPRWAPDGQTIYFTSRRAGFVNVWGRRFDPQHGIALADPFPVTKYEIPSRMLLPQIMQLHIALVHKHLILPLTDVTASIWVLDNVNQ